MRFCRFAPDRIGLMQDGLVFDVTEEVEPELRTDLPGDPLVRALPSLRNLRVRGAGVALETLHLLSPVALPTKIVAAPVNYRAHAAEATADPGIVYGHTETDIGKAGLFLKANSSLAGAGDGVAVRFPGRRTDYEAELVVVIGAGGSDIARGDALAHVAGYTVGLDMTLRGPEDRSFRKSLDGFSVVGPWLVTADEVPDPGALTLTLHQNGEKRQDARTAALVYDVPRLIEFASSFYTLHPGDLIFTGTPEGVGPVAPGDVLVAEVPGVGRLETRVRTHTPDGTA